MSMGTWPARRLRRILALWMVLVVVAGVFWWLNVFGARGTDGGLVGVSVGIIDLLGWFALILLPPLVLWVVWRLRGGGQER